MVACFDSMDAAWSIAVAKVKNTKKLGLPNHKLNLKTPLAGQTLRWNTRCWKRLPLTKSWPHWRLAAS